MLERLKEVGGAFSAAVALLATGIAVVKWIQNAGHELPPILLSLGLLATGLVVAIAGVVLAWLAIRHRDRELAGAAIVELLVAGLVAWLASRVELLSTLFSGEYRTHSVELIAVGIGTWLAAVVLLLGAARSHLTARKATDWAPRGRKLCPECAEYPKRAARVCRHCGHRFAAPLSVKAS
ncbi:MAG TPA: hypothetical protein VGF47_11985 [Solirubrobacteraceae bacterium]|jgi:hypothetical protein